MTLSVPRATLLGLALLAIPLVAAAQVKNLLEAPSVEGKDVMWVPTPDVAVERMLAMARVGPRDLVVDLGSGDGRIPIIAAKRFGARGLGIEYSADLVAKSRRSAALEGVAERVQFIQADLFEADFRTATVVTLYLLTSLNLKLRPKILDMRPGTRVVSHVFRMGDWEPDDVAKVGSSDLYLWIVPAKVAGRWRVTAGADQSFELVLEQRHQRVAGNVTAEGLTLPLDAARVSGDAVRFSFSDARGVRQSLTGRVADDRMEGSDGGWRATRLKPGAR